MRELTKEEFRRKYSKDNHLGLHCESDLANKLSGGSLIKKSPGDKNIKFDKHIPGKDLIEKAAVEQRAENFKHYLLDAVAVRKQEILDKKEVPMVQLLQIVSRNLPQKVESKNEHTFTFADMVKRATIELQKVETVDV